MHSVIRNRYWICFKATEKLLKKKKVRRREIYALKTLLCFVAFRQNWFSREKVRYATVPYHSYKSSTLKIIICSMFFHQIIFIFHVCDS